MLILTRREYFPFLYALKEKNPSLNFKAMEKSEFLDLAVYSFSKDPTPLLMKDGISYSSAKKYLNLLRVRELGTAPYLDELEKRLDALGYLHIDGYAKSEIASLDVKLFRIEQDEELVHLLERKGIPYSSFDIPDGFVPTDLSKAPEILLFTDKFSQYMYVFSDIRKRIEEDPSLASRITLLAKDESDWLYAQLIAPRFGIPVYAKHKRMLFSYPEVKKAVSGIFENKSFAHGEGESEPEKELWRLVDRFELAGLDFNFAYANLLEILQSSTVIEANEIRGVEVVTTFGIDPSKIVYAMDFAYGSFYKEFADKNVYSDEELRRFQCNPSYVRTALDRQLKLDYLSFHKDLFLSRVKAHLSDSIFPSQLIEELNWGRGCEKTSSWNTGGLYSPESIQFAKSDYYDRHFDFEKHGEVRSYDHSFKGINFQYFEEDHFWSVTNLESYISCPFQYLMKGLLPEQGDSDYFARAFGSLVHKVFEDVYHSDFDFKAAYEKGAEEFRKYYQRVNAPFGPRDEALLEVSEHWLDVFSGLHREWLNNANIKSISDDSEVKVPFELSDEDGVQYKFRGRVDKIVWTDDGASHYYTIVDYKTGRETFSPFEVFLGKSTQLPIYYYALGPKEKPELAGCVFGGFGLQHIYPKTLKAGLLNEGLLDPSVYRNLSKLSGVVRDEESYWRSIDNTAFKKAKTPVVKASGGSFVARKHGFQGNGEQSLLPNAYRFYGLSDLVEDAKKALVSTIKKIESGEFPIAPTYSDLKANHGARVCDFCSYRNVCYRRISTDLVSYGKTIQEHFAKEDES